MYFLFISTKDSIFDMAFALESMGHQLMVMDNYQFDPLNVHPVDELQAVETHLSTHKYNYVISYLYITTISDLCQKYGIPYISWIYDSPLVSVFHRSIFNSVNRVFIFDHSFYERMVQIGVPHVYYMPLAANVDRSNAINFTDTDAAKYTCDISFIGSLYEGNSYQVITQALPAECTVSNNRYLYQHLCNWHDVRSWPSLSKTCMAYLENANLSKENILDFEFPAPMYLGNVTLTRKLAEMERIICLNTLAEHHTIDLYTTSHSTFIDSLRVHPAVNYYTELGKVYYYSRINLNFTLPSIETGIPQRIYDIMAYGGFVLSNYQAEMDTLFTPGKDIAVFRDLGELKEAVDYYLNHKRERLEIALAGCKKVTTLYSYQNRLSEILEICEQVNSNESSS